MHNLHAFDSRAALDEQLSDKVASILTEAVRAKGKASIAVSGGSTPKGFFEKLSQKDLPWDQVTITLADERWVNIDSDASNTRLVHENLMQNNAVKAKFFHLKQGDALNQDVLKDLNLAAESTLLPFDVLILGMGEDGHTASLFPCSDEIDAVFAADADSLLKVVPKTAPHDRITFSYPALEKSKNIILHISGESKKNVLNQALTGSEVAEMPIRAFLNHPSLTTDIFWAE